MVFVVLKSKFARGCEVYCFVLVWVCEEILIYKRREILDKEGAERVR